MKDDLIKLDYERPGLVHVWVRRYDEDIDEVIWAGVGSIDNGNLKPWFFGARPTPDERRAIEEVEREERRPRRPVKDRRSPW